MGQDGKHFCHYDTGSFKSLDAAMSAARAGFNPEPFILFPYTPYSRQEILERAPDAVSDLLKGREQG